MIIGEYTNKISGKKRVAIPKKIRDQMRGEIILTRGYEGSLVLVDKEMWDGLGSEILNGSFINKNIRDTTRFLVGSAIEVEPDEQGRFVIPTNLFEYANLNDEIVFVGLINWVEIWSKERWNERVEYITQNSEIIADELSRLNDE